MHESTNESNASDLGNRYPETPGWEKHFLTAGAFTGYMEAGYFICRRPDNLFLQQVINGLQLGFVYALIALGYTMVYGIVRLINFAHGDVFMVGAFTSYYAIARLGLNTWPICRLPRDSRLAEHQYWCCYRHYAFDGYLRHNGIYHRTSCL